MRKITVVISLFFTINCFAYNHNAWRGWVRSFKPIAMKGGIHAQIFDPIFQGLTPSRSHMSLAKKQPEHRLTYYKYRNSRGDNYRIQLGKKYYRQNKTMLNQIGHEYGVNPCFIVALWGLESSYGHFMGNFDVIRSLATLSYMGHRRLFFEKQLVFALRMLQNGVIDRKDFKGEWAGASGQTQFMPSSWYNYAVDYNGDGKKDIWKTKADIFASIANYLRQNGWEKNQYPSVLTKVVLPNNFDNDLLSLKVTKTVREWHHLGVRFAENIRVNPNREASIIQPYGGPTIMIFENFRVLMRWNYSSYYAGTVNYVAQRICQ
ncbi:MAG: lytic murein transglycosylase [Gammaproteobacteria bacterium]|nr:lytic murein transglycosylase [Gammaproteobacteria bacterium]